MLFGNKKSYQLKERSEKKNSALVGKYPKKTEKSITPSSSQSSTNLSTGLLSKNKIPKEDKKKAKSLKKYFKKQILKICNSFCKRNNSFCKLDIFFKNK